MDTQPTWDWSSVDDHKTNDAAEPEPGSSTPESTPYSTSYAKTFSRAAPEPTPSQPEQPRAAPQDPRYGPRTCRICFDTEQPKYPTATTTMFGIASASSKPTYASDDPELGRLLSPCKCKGSQKYVHEGCLNAWRLANPTEARNYWQCPTCKFTYRVSRLHWATALTSKWAQIALTVLILIISVFALGFIADPIFNLWNDPVGTISDTVTSVVTDIEAMRPPPQEEPVTWYEHFVKGFFSLGLVGIFKTMFAVTPWQWLNLRSSGLMGTGNRRQGTGRARVENISWLFVLIGAFTFLMGIWKGVKVLSARILKSVSDRVLDVDEDDDESHETEADPERKKDQ